MAKGIGHDFMIKTRYRCLDMSDQMRGRPQPPLELEYGRQNDVIDLPRVEDFGIEGANLLSAIQNRRSIRSYSADALAMNELSFLLWATQGVKEVLAQTATLRTVPSAGARHAFETFLLVNNVATLRPGLYRFLATQHKLIAANLTANVADMVVEGCLGQAFVKQCAVTFIWVAVPYRMNWRYGERGYRYLHLDAGHVCQNLYLAAEAVHCGVCAIAAFEDDTMNRILGVDGEDQFVIYIATVGKKTT
jgi:SagB-type dehydrogenase family enzyme